MTDFTVAFIGLPSSGKSSIINSLIGKRILESGICRTTTEYNLLDNIIEDDNNNKFQVMDLPGICDSEEHNVNFNELTNKHIINANLIIWTTDVNKAFITTHEVNEYNRIKKILNDTTNETGKLYYLIIMLSKCDKDINNINNNVSKKDKKIKKSNEEISDSDEDTDINDLINKVHEKFSNEDIIYFNAFGRSFYNEKSTETLKKFISKTSMPITQNNITFNISKYIENYDIYQIDKYYDHFQEKFILFIHNTTSKVEQILEIWNNITDENKKNFLSKLFEDYPNIDVSEKLNIEVLKIFQFLSCETIIKYDNTNILHNKIIYYYLYILINYDSLTYSVTDIIENINNSFKLLNYNQQEVFYNKLLFDYNFNSNYRATILLNLDWSKKTYYNFENMFNKFFNYDLSDTTQFTNTIKTLINKKYGLNYNKKYELNYDKTKTITDNFNDYLSLLDNIYNDYDYILLNKVQILYNIIINTNAFHTNYHINCSYYELIKSYKYIPYERLRHNQKWLDKNDKIWRKIYSNIQIEFDFDFEMDEFILINKLELLYNSKDI